MLLVGVLVFVFYLFHAPPLLFNRRLRRAGARRARGLPSTARVSQRAFGVEAATLEAAPPGDPS